MEDSKGKKEADGRTKPRTTDGREKVGCAGRLGGLFLFGGAVLLPFGFVSTKFLICSLLSFFMFLVSVLIEAIGERWGGGGDGPIYPGPGFFGD